MSKYTSNEEIRHAWQEEELISVSKDIDDSWRHGNHVSEVFRLEGTEEYYEIFYSVSGDGEYHGIRENEFEFQIVQPYTETTTVIKYKRVDE